MTFAPAYRDVTGRYENPRLLCRGGRVLHTAPAVVRPEASLYIITRLCEEKKKPYKELKVGSYL